MTTTKPISHHRARWRRRGEAVSGQIAGDAHEGSLTSAAPRPNGQAPAAAAARSPGQSVAGAMRQRQPEWAGGWACPVGNASVPLTAPASALSSQSEQPLAVVTTQRTLPSALAAATPAENACVA